MRYLIRTDTETNISIGNNLIDKVGELLKSHRYSAYVVLCSKTTKKLYSERLITSLSTNNVPIELYELPDGEAAKSMEVVMSICSAMLEENIDRKAAIIALGGGALGDTATVIAGLYHRGIDYIQIPTTLLAQVDSTLGGKGAVNVGKYKNMLGVVQQPKAVIIDTSLLSSLPKEQLQSGMGEVIKYAIAFDPQLFSLLEKAEKLDKDLMAKCIEVCVRLKMERVQKDPLDKKDIRMELNLGHTIGHAIELLGRLSHGQAIAIGMAYTLKLSVTLGMLSKEKAQKALLLLQKYNLPIVTKGINKKEVLKIIKSDKKSLKGVPRFVLLRDIGKTVSNVSVPKDVMEKTLSEVLQ